MFLIAKTVTMRSNQIMLLLINFKRTRICLIICFALPCPALAIKQHYYFDKVERKYHHLDNTLSQATKEFLHQKIEAEITLIKRTAAANNIVLLLTTALSAIFAGNAIHTRLRFADEVDQHNLHISIMLTGLSALNAIRGYAFKKEIDKKIAKLVFKQSLLGI